MFPSITVILSIISVPHECYFFSNLMSFFTDGRSCYTSHEIIFFGTLSLSSRPLYSYYPLWYHFEPPIIIYFVVTKWRIMSQSWTLMSYVWFLLKLDRSFITWYGLKLSLRLLFGIMNILSLGWGTSRTYLLKSKKWKKKNVDYHGSTQKKNIEKDKKSRAKNIKKFGLYVER
jgi:hypothetical protein